MTRNTGDGYAKVKALRLMQWFVPVTSLLMAGLCYVFIGDAFAQYICVGLIFLAAAEFFGLRSVATKAERRMQRDRG